ncbi:hypothetical protein SKAU_G00269480 [Synaphobranchus kaupii]|uniref:Uncharacterized protein n=1 Tax=Synaphobranchus kaupii TaxID=118154 RepID=A0A9Q1IQF1_SYNKA|nr:hypothetical protein SKAU_G00269480 [Synaphobranchus kaupii]
MGGEVRSVRLSSVLDKLWTPPPTSPFALYGARPVECTAELTEHWVDSLKSAPRTGSSEVTEARWVMAPRLAPRGSALCFAESSPAGLIWFLEDRQMVEACEDRRRMRQWGEKQDAEDTHVPSLPQYMVETP